jgi:hypothetical protein
MAKVALLTVHGMGSETVGYANELKAELRRRLKNGFDDVSFQEVFYQDILEKNERRYWDQVKDDLRWQALREFLLFGFADASGLEANKEDLDSAYALAQIRIARSFLRAYQDMGNTNGPVVVLAQSLGSQVMSNYLWDCQRARKGAKVDEGIWADLAHYEGAIAGRPLRPEEIAALRGPNLRRFVTTGCNIPLFVAAHDLIVPIDPPAPGFEWHNYYDRDDVLGWPLGGLSNDYGRLVTDHAINAGGKLFDWLLKSWNPLSHGSYWADDDVLDPLEAALRAFL